MTLRLLVAIAGGLDGAKPSDRSGATPPQLAAAWSVVTDPRGTITVELRRPNDIADPPGTTERTGPGVVIRVGVMAPGGRVTCEP